MKRGRASNTALVVAAGLQLARDGMPAPAPPQRLGGQLLRHACPRLAGLLRRPWFRRLCMLVERATLPGICLHFALRKALLRRHAQAAIADGCTQVVVLGAGLDTLCAELKAANPALCCIEIDHPATQAVKRAAAAAASAKADADADGAAADGVIYIAADLACQDPGALLRAHPHFRAGASTLFVAEGLLMYMPLDAVRALFARLAMAAPDCRVAFTWLEPQADGQPNFRQHSRLVDAWLRWRGEPFLSGMARTALARFLADAGFALLAIKASSDLVDGSCAARRPIEGEYIALAARRDRSIPA